jgi:hypothetical protein
MRASGAITAHTGEKPMTKKIETRTKQLKTRMQGAMLRAFAAGRITDQEAQQQGYDPQAVRKHHHLDPEPAKAAKQPSQPDSVEREQTNGNIEGEHSTP